jgi:hypothetical protein
MISFLLQIGCFQNYFCLNAYDEHIFVNKSVVGDYSILQCSNDLLYGALLPQNK